MSEKDKDEMTEEYTNHMIRKAETFAEIAHDGQKRKGGKDVPYITHPFAVAEILKENGATTEAILGGLLHDVVEDTSSTLEDVGDAFGRGVMEVVDFVSEEGVSPEGKAPWKVRKTAYIERLQNAPYDAVLVASADKLSNVRDTVDDYKVVGEGVWKMFNSQKPSQYWYYTTLIALFESRGIPSKIINELKSSMLVLHKVK